MKKIILEKDLMKWWGKLPPKKEATFLETKIIQSKNIKENEKDLNNKLDNNFYWLKYKENYCRYDVFSLLYYLVLEDALNINIINGNLDEIISFYNTFVNSISILDKKDLNLGVWNVIDKLNKDPLNLKEEGYKNVYAISQLFSQLKYNKNCCFEIEREEKCFKCNYNNIYNDYFGPIIKINFEDLNSDIKKTIEKNLLIN